MRVSPEVQKSEWRSAVVSILGATALACVVLLTLLGHKALTDWDEGIYAEVSREMLGGSWLVPHWNGQVWFEKPPLMLWITAVFFKVFGVSEFWARAGSALSGVAIVGLLHGWLVRRDGRLAAWLGTVILLSTFGFLHVCRVGEMDVLLSLGCWVALCGLTAVAERRLAGWYGFWGGFASAAMTKGSASVVLLLTVVVVAVVERWSWRSFGREFGLGVLLFLAVVLPWHLAMFHLYGQAFLGEYLSYHVLARATHAIEGHVTHWWYYLWVIFVSAMPWVLVYPMVMVAAWRRVELRVWVVFVLVVVGFFSVVQTRLPHYVAPAYPALAVVTAVFLAERVKEFVRRGRDARTSVVAGVVLVVVVGSVLLTGGARGGLHRARGADGRVVAVNNGPALLLRAVFQGKQAVQGPVLVWWEDATRSIATSVFYSRRRVQQVQLSPPAADEPVDRYVFDPVSLDTAVGGCRILLLDKELMPQIPRAFVFEPIASGRTMVVGTIRRR
jgi:4-amino-4-deoxy-L-arabinose transferase-like glycosyltransferase